MIFPHLQLEDAVQVNDRTRLSGVKTYTSPDEDDISLVEIQPENLGPWIDVTEARYLDWQYSTDGEKAVTIRVTTDGPPVTVTRTIQVLDPDDDKLFSSDSDIEKYEPDILKYVREGRNTHLDAHRAAQRRIMQVLDERRVTNTQGERLTLDAVLDVEEFRAWSKFLTLSIIFEGISNAVDDIFAEKSRRYRKLADEAANRGVLRLDYNGSGDVSASEFRDMKTTRMIRR